MRRRYGRTAHRNVVICRRRYRRRNQLGHHLNIVQLVASEAIVDKLTNRARRRTRKVWERAVQIVNQIKQLLHIVQANGAIQTAQRNRLVNKPRNTLLLMIYKIQEMRKRIIRGVQSGEVEVIENRRHIRRHSQSDIPVLQNITPSKDTAGLRSRAPK